MSILKELHKQRKITKDVEALIASLTLEELVQLKFDIASRAIGGEPYGFKVWSEIPEIAKKAVFCFARDHFKTNNAASRFLGISLRNWMELKKNPNYSNSGE
jgi:hypothetical protein